MKLFKIISLGLLLGISAYAGAETRKHAILMIEGMRAIEEFGYNCGQIKNDLVEFCHERMGDIHKPYNGDPCQPNSGLQYGWQCLQAEGSPYPGPKPTDTRKRAYLKIEGLPGFEAFGYSCDQLNYDLVEICHGRIGDIPKDKHYSGDPCKPNSGLQYGWNCYKVPGSPMPQPPTPPTPPPQPPRQMHAMLMIEGMRSIEEYGYDCGQMKMDLERICHSHVGEIPPNKHYTGDPCKPGSGLQYGWQCLPVSVWP